MTEIDDIEFGESQSEDVSPAKRPTLRVSVSSYDCYSQLWLAVLLRAVEDASLHLKEARMHKHNMSCPRDKKSRTIICDKRLLTESHVAQKEAREWFLSANTAPCSLLWICSTLDLDPEVIRRELRKRIEANAEDARLGRTGPNRAYPRAVLHHHSGERGAYNPRVPRDDSRRAESAYGGPNLLVRTGTSSQD